MSKRRWNQWWIKLLVAVLLLSCPPLLSGQDKTATITQIELSGKLAEVVANTPTGTEAGQINLQAEKGFAGIPGAPQINYIVAFLWAIWVGWIFTTVGAFGGIMLASAI